MARWWRSMRERRAAHVGRAPRTVARGNTEMNRYLFCHIPKTAGTMFTSILRRNFGGAFLRDNLFYADIRYEPRHVQDAFLVLSHRCFASHALRATSYPTEVLDPVVAMSFIRSPVEHAVSGYFDLRNRVAGPHHPVTQMSLSELTENWRASGFGKEYAYTFSQFEWLYPQVADKRSRLETDLAAGRLLLFPTLFLDDALIYLETAFGEDFRDCSYGVRENVSTKDHDLSAADIESVESLPWIEENRWLFDRASEFLHDSLLGALGSEAAIEDSRRHFENRCREIAAPALDASMMRSEQQSLGLRLSLQRLLRRILA
jgi:hypothetical protein